MGNKTERQNSELTSHECHLVQGRFLSEIQPLKGECYGVHVKKER